MSIGALAAIGALTAIGLMLIGAFGSVLSISGGNARALTDPRAVAHAQDTLGVAPTAQVRQGGDSRDDRGEGANEAATPYTARTTRPSGWYRLAAAEYGVSPRLLEALHQVESNASPDSCIPNRQGSGAIGPFQFKAATFGQYGVDANHDGVADVCSFADSLFSAARYLRAIGADDDPASPASRRALRRYGTDVERVVVLALAYKERDSLVALAPVSVRH